MVTNPARICSPCSSYTTRIDDGCISRCAPRVVLSHRVCPIWKRAQLRIIQSGLHRMVAYWFGGTQWRDYTIQARRSAILVRPFTSAPIASNLTTLIEPETAPNNFIVCFVVTDTPTGRAAPASFVHGVAIPRWRPVHHAVPSNVL